MEEAAIRLEALDGLLRVSVALRRHIDEVGARHGLTGPQVRLLIGLDRPLRMQAAAEATACEPSHLTAVAEQLVRVGLLSREPDATDRRVRHLVLTPSGSARREELLSAVLVGAPVISQLGPGACARLAALLSGRFTEDQ